MLVPGLAELALELIRTRYADFGPTLACEKLEELHDLRLGKETVRRIMELLFVKSESTFSYFEATRRYILKHGKPLALYSDKAGGFLLTTRVRPVVMVTHNLAGRCIS